MGHALPNQSRFYGASSDLGVVLRKALREAINLANNVASKLEPSQRDAATKETARLFKGFFGHDPTWPVSWAGNKASGAIVAHRFRMVARGLGGGRRMLFRCGCPGAGAGAEVVARTNADMTT
jgi:hypothetical protein